MKAFLIDPQDRTITLQNFDGHPNSLYTLFGSLLVDAADALNDHSLYSSTEAFERAERGFLVGEKLIFGKTLLAGIAGFEDTDATITQDELRALTRFELPAFYTQTIALLPKTFMFGNAVTITEEHSLTGEWIIYAYNMADTKTKTYFLNELESTIRTGKDVTAFMKKMGEIALRSMQ